MNLITTRLLILVGLRTMDVQQILETYGGLPPSAFTVQAEASESLAARFSIDELFRPKQSNVNKITHFVMPCKIL